ncbi:MAG: hypothetical protein KME57_14205 [Scytonema hyalinum WJT4-NPBG1]|nr:hypothetical protein [Scytonema hyalinum WJT4-NPBG1]
MRGTEGRSHENVFGGASRRRKAKAQEMSYAIAGVTEKPTRSLLAVSVGDVT